MIMKSIGLFGSHAAALPTTAEMVMPAAIKPVASFLIMLMFSSC
jgi:hypothetical protein